MRTFGRVPSDVLVIGGGAAGVRAALAASENGAKTMLVCKSPIARSGITITAGGGIQAPFHPEDSEALFFQDVVRYGYGLADEPLVEALTMAAADRVLDLERYGVRFRMKEDGTRLQYQMPGQSAPRNVRLAAEGVGMMRGLHGALLRSSVTVLEDVATVSLLQAEEGSVVGASCLDVRSGQPLSLLAKSVILATGGCQALWDVTDCPTDATGDGLVLAYESGAELIDLEMILFYPSIIVHPLSAKGSFVHYEWLSDWACDGEIRDVRGASVLPKPLPVRDVAMRTMWRAIQEGRGAPHGGLWWDVSDSPKGYVAVDAFLQGQQYRYLRDRLGIDPSRTPIEVAPGAHYQLGGVRINRRSKTNVSGLFAVPETAGNIEGANRLSGSALAATQVFGEIAGREAAARASRVGQVPPSQSSQAYTRDIIDRRLGFATDPREAPILRTQLRKLVGRCLGIERSEMELTRGREELSVLSDGCDRLGVRLRAGFQQPLLEILELEKMIGVAELLFLSALERRESRGHHYRSDFPETESGWRCHTCVSSSPNGPRIHTAAIDQLGQPGG